MGPSPVTHLSAYRRHVFKVGVGSVLVRCQPRSNTSASSAVLLAITLKLKISQKSSKELCWESFTASEQSAWLPALANACFLSPDGVQNAFSPREGSPRGRASSALPPDSSASRSGSTKLLSSAEAPARKQAWAFGGLRSCIFSAGRFTRTVKNKQANGCFFIRPFANVRKLLRSKTFQFFFFLVSQRGAERRLRTRLPVSLCDRGQLLPGPPSRD